MDYKLKIGRIVSGEDIEQIAESIAHGELPG